MLQIITAALFAIVSDEALRQRIRQLFENTPKVSNEGGMTLDMGSGPIVVCYGKPSLADEKRLRAELRTLNAKVKLSRTNDVKQRCEQYDIASNAKEWAKMFEADKPKAKAKGDTAVEQQSIPVAS